MGVKFLIISSGYNCSTFVKKCYDSIVSQTYKNFDAIIIDDGSDQATKDALISLNNSDPRIEIFTCSENKGAAYRRWQALHGLSKKKFDPETVIVLLGLDDELFSFALETIEDKYLEGNWMTYGNWIAQDGYQLPDGFLPFCPTIHAERSYRKSVYRSTGLNTFKKFLFDQLTEEDFKVNGEWVKATTESNLMFSCLEMCGKDRIGIIYKPIVLYNKGRKDNARRRFGDEYQDGIYKDVINRPKKDLLVR